MSGIISFITSQLQSNQIAQAAIIAAPTTALVYSAKALPHKLYRGFKKLVSLEVRFNSDSPDYEAIARYITKEVVRDTFSRNFVYQTESKWDNEEWTEETKHHGLTAGYGTHFGMFKRHLVIVDRSLDETSTTEKYKENMVLTFFGRSKKIAKEFAAEVAKAAGENVEAFETVPVHVNSGSHWQRMSKLPLRRMESVFTAEDAGQKLVQIVRNFEASRTEHHRLGLPHHLGIMLHGDPGCGKSSLIHALATELERTVFYLNLGSVSKDSELLSLFSGNRDWSKILVAVEDIDAAGVKVTARQSDDDEGVPKAPESSPVTMSALLNSLDGILCPDGLVVIGTTNHHDQLDPALIRAGRFDHTIELKKLGQSDLDRMARMFGRNPLTLPNVELPMSGAAMRALIMDKTAA